jgi:transposase
VASDKKNGRRYGRTIVLLDESGFMLQPLVRRTWGPQGKTPIQYASARHDRASVISAITVSPSRRRCGLYFSMRGSNITYPDVGRFVKAIRRQIGRPIILVLDRWSVHKSAVKRCFNRLQNSLRIEWLPAYAPDLNPAEQIWNRTKYSDLANFLPDSIQHLRSAVYRSLRRTRSMQRIIRSFFGTAQLKL